MVLLTRRISRLWSATPTSRLCSVAQSPRLCSVAQSPRLCSVTQGPRLCSAAPRHRSISTFHMDDSARGRLGPYLGLLKGVSLLSTLVLAGVGGTYYFLNRHLDQTYPIRPEIQDPETRRLLRGALLREHIAPDPRIAYMFLLRALEKIYAGGELAEDSEVVQEIVVRMAKAAAAVGEKEPALRMLWDAWTKVEEGEYGAEWRAAQVFSVVEVLGPLLMEQRDARAVDLYGAALRLVRVRLEAGGGDGLLLLKSANYTTSLAESFALAGDYENAQGLLRGLLGDMDKMPERSVVDGWTCLDAVVMLDLAQVSQGLGNLSSSREWAERALERASKYPGVGACENCRTHLLEHQGRLAEAAGDKKRALEMYEAAVSHAIKTHTGNIRAMEQAVQRIKQEI